MNLLSVAAAYGAVAAGRRGRLGRAAVGIDTPTPVPPFIPVMMFAILFGLSMDYEVFLLGRVREEYAAHRRRPGRPSPPGWPRTATVITAAAAIMVAVFLSFVVPTDVFQKLIGVGLATAIFVDATVIRMLLVPSVMQLMGRANWWLPGWLGRAAAGGGGPVTRLAPPRREAGADHPGVVAGVGWLGLHAVLVLLTATGLATGSDATMRAVYVTGGMVGELVFPFAGISLVSGLVLSLGTAWGLVRHWWVLAKLVINVVMLAVSGAVLSRFLAQAADRARDGAEVGDLGTRVVIGSCAGLVLLVVATALSVYRPRGRTPWASGVRGRRLGGGPERSRRASPPGRSGRSRRPGAGRRRSPARRRRFGTRRSRGAAGPCAGPRPRGSSASSRSSCSSRGAATTSPAAPRPAARARRAGASPPGMPRGPWALRRSR